TVSRRWDRTRKNKHISLYVEPDIIAPPSAHAPPHKYASQPHGKFEETGPLALRNLSSCLNCRCETARLQRETPTAQAARQPTGNTRQGTSSGAFRGSQMGLSPGRFGLRAFAGVGWIGRGIAPGGLRLSHQLL